MSLAKSKSEASKNDQDAMPTFEFKDSSLGNVFAEVRPILEANHSKLPALAEDLKNLQNMLKHFEIAQEVTIEADNDVLISWRSYANQRRWGIFYKNKDQGDFVMLDAAPAKVRLMAARYLPELLRRAAMTAKTELVS